ARLGDVASPAPGLAEACTELLALLEEHNRKEEPIIYPHMDADLAEHEQVLIRVLLEEGPLPEGWICQRCAEPPAAGPGSGGSARGGAPRRGAGSPAPGAAARRRARIRRVRGPSRGGVPPAQGPVTGGKGTAEHDFRLGCPHQDRRSHGGVHRDEGPHTHDDVRRTS